MLLYQKKKKKLLFEKSFFKKKLLLLLILISSFSLFPADRLTKGKSAKLLIEAVFCSKQTKKFFSRFS
jgi:hypothetical protein